MAEWGKSDPVATWGASDPVAGTARDRGRAASEQAWKRKLGSLDTRNAKGQTFEDFWKGYSAKAYDAAGKPAPGAPGGPTRAQAGARRDMAARDAARAKRERIPVERAALEQDRSSALVQGYGFGLGDEIMGLRSAAKTGIMNALGQDQGYTAREAYDARSAEERRRLGSYTRERPVEATVNALAGGLMNPLNMVAGQFIGPARAAGSVTRAAGVGGAMGAAYGAGSAEPGSRMKGAAVSGGVGAVTGGLAQVAGNALAGRVATAPMRPPSPQREISRQGVQLTPGQMMGGSAQRLEDAFTSVPVSGDAIRDAQRRGVQSFNRVAMDRVLAPIGGTGDDVGRAGMRDTSQQVSDAYQRALGGVTVAPDQQFAQDLAGVAQTPNLPPAIRDDLGALLGDVQARLAGPVDGQTWKVLDADLGAAIRAADAGSATQPSQRLLRNALIELRQAVGGAMARADPQAFGAVRQADEASAVLARVREASQGQGTAARDGIFTAGDLNRAVRGMDTSAGNRAYAQRDALLQDLAEPAMQVLPQTVPDSGTALRSAFTASPQGLIVGGVTGIPTALIYSRPVQYVLNAIYRASDGVQAEAGLQQLAQLAARNPALAPLYIELQGRLGAPVGAPGTAAQTQAPPTTR
jgi:hypothetical protein